MYYYHVVIRVHIVITTIVRMIARLTKFIPEELGYSVEIKGEKLYSALYL